jgi:hypothetical protein
VAHRPAKAMRLEAIFKNDLREQFLNGIQHTSTHSSVDGSRTRQISPEQDQNSCFSGASIPYQNRAERATCVCVRANCMISSFVLLRRCFLNGFDLRALNVPRGLISFLHERFRGFRHLPAMRQGIVFHTIAPKIDQLTQMENAKTYGEELFEEYLIAEGVRFECEPPIYRPTSISAASL